MSLTEKIPNCILMPPCSCMRLHGSTTARRLQYSPAPWLCGAPWFLAVITTSADLRAGPPRGPSAGTMSVLRCGSCLRERAVKEDGQAISVASRAGLLLAGIRRRRPEFEAAGERAEELRTLPGETVATLRAMGAFWLKTPAELGGTPLAPLDFCDVMEEFGYADAATAWMVMVGNGGTGTAGGWLPDAGAGRVFAPGRPLPLVV